MHASSGTPWPPSWEPEENCTGDLVATFERRVERVEGRRVTVSMQPLLHLVRSRVATTLLIAKTKARPRVHEVVVPELALADLGRAFLEMVRAPEVFTDASASRSPLPIVKTLETDGAITHQVNYTSLDQIASFCALEHFMGIDRGGGALRWRLGRASNMDLMLIGMPLQITICTNKPTAGLVSFSLTFPTVHVNGSTGRLTYPLMARGMLKEPVHRRSGARASPTCAPRCPAATRSAGRAGVRCR